MQIKVKLLREGAKLPFRASPGSAGYDVWALEDRIIQPGTTMLVSTGLVFELPDDIEINVRPRSGLTKKGVVVMLGTVDPDYRGEVGVQLFNLSNFPHTIQAGDRIAQLIFNRIVSPLLVETDEVEDTARGSGGFGSTGR